MKKFLRNRIKQLVKAGLRLCENDAQVAEMIGEAPAQKLVDAKVQRKHGFRVISPDDKA